MQLTVAAVTLHAGHAARRPAEAANVVAAAADVRCTWSLSEMTWKFDNLVKGQVTQSILSVALEGVGYSVHRLGVEELIPELRGPKSAEIRVNLSEQMRFIPDLVVIEPYTGEVYLVEVKFRRSISESFVEMVFQEVERRRKYWPGTYTVLLVAESRLDRGFHQDHIRIIPPNLTEDQFKSSGKSAWDRWDSLPQLQHVFKRIFGDTNNQQIVDSITTVLRDLAKVETPRTLNDITRGSEGDM